MTDREKERKRGEEKDEKEGRMNGREEGERKDPYGRVDRIAFDKLSSWWESLHVDRR